MNVYEKLGDVSVYDDVLVVLVVGLDICLIWGDVVNFKLIIVEDFECVEVLLGKMDMIYVMG